MVANFGIDVFIRSSLAAYCSIVQHHHNPALSLKLSATTDIGVIYGLETLLQLVDNNADDFFVHGVKIKDYPRFTWRGLMIDVARHFQPIDALKRNLDAMAANKLLSRVVAPENVYNRTASTTAHSWIQ